MQTRSTQEHTDTMCMCGWVCVVELTWHWGEDVGAVGQVVGVVELYSAVLVHRPDHDCRQTHETYAHYTTANGLALEHTVLKQFAQD